MSGSIVRKFWHLGKHKYVFYRFELEDFCRHCFLKPGLILLDAGCGPKVSSLSHVPQDVFGVGVDINSRNAAESHSKAKAKGNRNLGFVVADLTRLPFRSECIDLVLCCDVLEHIKAKQETIHEIRRVCKQHGKFIGSTTNILNPIMFLDSHLVRRILSVPIRKFSGEHYERHSRFTPNGLLHSLSNAKFQECEIKLLGFPPFRAAQYEFSNEKIPWFAFLWIAFDTLTNKRKLRLLKEMMVFFAERN